MKHAGQVLRDELTSTDDIEPFLGIYDCFSASIAAPYSSTSFSPASVSALASTVCLTSVTSPGAT
jgi:hypothetical protein